jgi:hypothetical protein
MIQHHVDQLPHLGISFDFVSGILLNLASLFTGFWGFCESAIFALVVPPLMHCQ